MDNIFYIIFFSVASGVASFLVAKTVTRYALKMGIYTLTDGNQIAMWGGLAFIAPMLITAPVIIGISTGQSIIIFLAILSLALFGLLDDIIGFSPFPQLAMQICVAFLFALIFTKSHYDLTSLLSVGMVIIIAFALINAMNASNWVDGVDGLAAGVGIAGLSIIGIFFFLSGNYLYALYSLILVCALIGFLFFNYYPARLYMGTAGSMGIGLLVALMPATKWELAPLFLCAFSLPLGDYIFVIAQRILAGILPWQGGDRRHLHYRLVDMGWSKNKILSLYIIGTIIFTNIGIVGDTYSLEWLGVGMTLASVWTISILFNFTYSTKTKVRVTAN